MGRMRRRDFLRALSAVAGMAAHERTRALLISDRDRPESACFAASPAAGRVTASGAVVNLVTAENSTGCVTARVRWAENETALPQSPHVSEERMVAGPLQALELPLSGLAPSSEYWYGVEYESGAEPGIWRSLPAGRLRTQKPPGEAFDLCIMADTHWADLFFDFDLRTVWGYNALACIAQVLSEDRSDFCIDLGDCVHPNSVCSELDALRHYVSYRRVMASLFARAPVYFACGNHEMEAGFFQHGDDGMHSFSPFGNHLTPYQYAQKWSTHARLTLIPNPRGDTYPEGGEGGVDTDSSKDWGAGEDPWNDGERAHLQNFYAWSWGDALFVVLDPFRYTLPGAFVRPTRPSQWSLGETQRVWLTRTLSESTARWKFVIAHHLVGGGLIGTAGETIVSGQGLAYGRGCAIDAIRPGTEQAWIHSIMRAHGAQFFLYGHDHCFAHSEADGVHYLACGRPTHIERWFSRSGMQHSYGDVLRQGTDRPWMRQLLTVLGYTRLRIRPESVEIDWIRTGYSFYPNVIPCFTLDYPRRDWRESWCGRAYPVGGDEVEVESVPNDVDGVRTLDGAQLNQMYTEPAGEDYYLQPIPTRPESYAEARIPLSGYPAGEHPVAVVDVVPECVYSQAWSDPAGVEETAEAARGQRRGAVDEFPPAGALRNVRLEANPGRRGAVVTFHASQRLTGVRLVVLDNEGRTIDCVPLAPIECGPGKARWNGAPGGRAVGSGVYFLKIGYDGGETRACKQVILH